MRVRSIMHEKPVTVDEAAPVADVVEILRRSRVRHVLVTRAGKLVGIISDRDVREVATPALLPKESHDLMRMPVRNLMSTNVLTVSPDADLVAVVDLMLQGEVGAVPVVDDERLPLGIVSYVDVLRAARPLFSQSSNE